MTEVAYPFIRMIQSIEVEISRRGSVSSGCRIYSLSYPAVMIDRDVKLSRSEMKMLNKHTRLASANPHGFVDQKILKLILEILSTS